MNSNEVWDLFKKIHLEYDPYKVNKILGCSKSKVHNIIKEKPNKPNNSWGEKFINDRQKVIIKFSLSNMVFW